jgi:putative oxygen-independent coproporphyrinogen III oxidase
VSQLALYVHIPFCPQHCPYCAFAVLTGHYDLYERYVAAVCAEIHAWRHLAAKGPLQTVYFGGGTPSMLAPAQLERLLAAAATTFGLVPEAEITLEANPETAESAKFAAFRRFGCNRLSLGVQAFHDADLKILGRRHSVAEALQAYETARQAGFTNVNIDVIFSIPGTPRTHWSDTLEQLVALQPEHVSTYSLTIEEGTRFAQRYHDGRLQPVSEDDDAWAYAAAMAVLSTAGFEQYEVSNFALPGYRSRHNWGYWHGVEYLGVGLSAHTFLDGQRQWNTRDLQQYLSSVETGQSACAGQETLSPESARQEQVWLQLRTAAGAQLTAPELARLRHTARFDGLLHEGLMRLDGCRVSLTPRGYLLADAIGGEVVDMLAQADGPSLRRPPTCSVA